MGCCSLGNGAIHICGGNETETEWMPTNKMIKKWVGRQERRVPVHCCERWEMPRNTECRYYTAFGGYVAGHEFRCAPNKGCNANPGYKRTAHLRRLEY